MGSRTRLATCDRRGSKGAMVEDRSRCHHIDARLAEALYVDAMLLADDARHLAAHMPAEEEVDVALGITVACESLRLTTRLMHVLGWLLHRRAMARGEVAEASALAPVPATDPTVLGRLPATVRDLVVQSEALYRRAARLAAAPVDLAPSPARALQQRVALSLLAA